MRAWLAIVLCLVGSTAALGKQPEPWVVNLLVGREPLSAKERVETAKGLRGKADAVLAFLPHLKRSQVEWLASERAALDKLNGAAFESKAGELMRSPEFVLEKARFALTATLEALDCVLESSNSREREVLCWARVNLHLTDRGAMNDAFGVLEQERVITVGDQAADELHVHSRDDRWAAFFWWGRAVQERVVIPMLAGTDARPRKRE